jgi:hypothetical protein
LKAADAIKTSDAFREPVAALGHRSITSAAVHTALAPNRFKDFWRD